MFFRIRQFFWSIIRNRLINYLCAAEGLLRRNENGRTSVREQK
ncbi:hypothetical protein CLOSTASPAR_02961 [[Clostridium] asparagiforme DSM 15981]|uniref:Uncharacterized protein n=1 Tax=[Clostridium] asparagiforme DSM 15981 TaxID=518636 RepID=C0D124_9FIRM|nr:hypothetical protein CLOSTASPAR_02961 [[Clostridium] asparagiforme DSM 15981]